MVYHPRFSYTPTLVKNLSAIERAVGYLEGATFTAEWVSSMQELALFREAHSTTHVYGSHLYWNESAGLLAGREVAETRPDEVKALLNYKEAYGYLLELLKKEPQSVTEAVFLEMQSHLVKGVKGNMDHPGQYRTKPCHVLDKKTKEIVYTPPTALELSSLMRDFIDWFEEQKNLSGIIVAGLSHYQLVNIHPFVGGNGRTARLLSLYLLYQAGYECKRLYSLSPYYDSDISAYYNALLSVRQQRRDHTTWLEYFTEGLLKQLQEVLYEAKLNL